MRRSVLEAVYKSRAVCTLFDAFKSAVEDVQDAQFISFCKKITVVLPAHFGEDLAACFTQLSNMITPMSIPFNVLLHCCIERANVHKNVLESASSSLNTKNNSSAAFITLNTVNANVFHDAHWNVLQSLLGDKLITFFFEECSVFICTGKDCHFQIAGEPISAAVTNKNGQALQKARQFVLKSSVMFGNAQFNVLNVPHQFEVYYQILPPKMLSIRALYKEIFDTNDIKFDFMQQNKHFFERLSRRLKAIPIKQILDYYCPVDTFYEKSKAFFEEGIFITQSPDCLARIADPATSCLKDFHIEPHRIVAFVKCVLERAITREFVGRSNFNRMVKKVAFFVRINKFDCIKASDSMHGIKVTDFKWNFGKCARKTPQHFKMATLATQSFVFWIFKSLLVNLLKNCFYITESSMHKHQCAFLRHEIWLLLSRKFFESRLADGTFCEVDAASSGDRVHANPSRLYAKEKGFRLIVNLSKKRHCNGVKKFTSHNKVHGDKKTILRYISAHDPSLIGNSVLGRDEIYHRLLRFKQAISRCGFYQSQRPLYFAKIDIKACYDSIDAAKMTQILKDILRDRYAAHCAKSSFLVHGYTHIDAYGKRFAERAFSHDSFVAFPQFVAQSVQSSVRHGIIFADSKKYRSISVQDFETEICTVLQQNDILNGAFPGVIFRQQKGIAQGSVLSGLLCALYYGDLDRQMGLDAGAWNEMLVRYVDDYLIISTEREAVERFLALFSAPIASHNCVSNVAKTQTNVGSEAHSSITDFTYCGMNISLPDLSIRNVSAAAAAADSFDSIFCLYRPYAFSQHVLMHIKYYHRIRLGSALLDLRINSVAVADSNLRNAFSMVAKMTAAFFCRKSSGLFKPCLHAEYIFVKKLVITIKRYALNYLRAKQLRNAHIFCPRRQILSKIITEAFIEEFSRKPSKFHRIIKFLRLTAQETHL